MILHKDSHVDHVSRDVLNFVLARFQDRAAFFVETIDLPAGLTVSCELYGPVMGDPPVPESDVVYQRRGSRSWDSRMVARPARDVRQVTVVGGPYDGLFCVLYTVYGGKPAPQEPGDPALPEQSRAESESFWADHALSLG